MAKYDAILPAGGQIDPEFAKLVGTASKALIEIDGKTILERTLDALEESGLVGRKVVIGEADVRAHPSMAKADIVLDHGETGPDNIYRGLHALMESENPPEKVIIITTDLPLIAADQITRFVNACPPDRDVTVPLIRKGTYETRFPNSGNTYITLKDDSWTTGGIFLMNARSMMNIKPNIDSVFANRKSKLGMVKLLGAGFLFKFLTKTLTVPDVEKKILSMLGCTGAAVLDAPVELGYDIDYQNDYDYLMNMPEKDAR